MKTYLCYSVVAFFLTSFKAAADDQARKWGEVTNQVKMSISLNTQDTKVAANKPVVLRIVLKNVSTNETFSIYDSFREESDQAFSFAVTTPSGTDKALLTGPLHGSGAIITIPPGETWEREFNRSRLYDFREIGAYKVVAKYKTFFRPQYFEVVSSPLEVNVVKPDEKSEAPETNNPIGKWSP